MDDEVPNVELLIQVRTYKRDGKLDEEFLEEELGMGNYRIVHERNVGTTSVVDIDQNDFDADMEEVLNRWSNGIGWLKHDMLRHYVESKGFVMASKHELR